jgi:hypothetical protein
MMPPPRADFLHAITDLTCLITTQETEVFLPENVRMGSDVFNPGTNGPNHILDKQYDVGEDCDDPMGPTRRQRGHVMLMPRARISLATKGKC